MADLSIYFAFPGDLATPTGGYHYDRRLIDALRQSGITVATLPLPPCSLLTSSSSVAEQQAHVSVRQTFAALPDQAIVVIDGLAFGVLDELAQAEAQRLRLVALCHHPLALETGLAASQQQALVQTERRALQAARATVVTSEHTRQILLDHYALPPAKICVALPGCDAVGFAPCDGNPLRLLTVASLTRRKGHDVLIEALAASSALPWQARFVGGVEFDPAWARHLQERVTAVALSERISFAGPVADAQAEYQQADVFVLPSHFEGYGMVFAEALAAGLPIIATHAGAVPQVVPPTAGLLVAPDDIGALTDALQQLLTNKSLRQQLQAGARQAATTLPTWSDCASRVARTLAQVRST